MYQILVSYCPWLAPAPPGGSAVGLLNDNIGLRSTLSRKRYPEFYILSYLWHSSLALESPPHSIVDTLGFPPARVNTFESVALMAVEALNVWTQEGVSVFMHDLWRQPHQ